MINSVEQNSEGVGPLGSITIFNGSQRDLIIYFKNIVRKNKRIQSWDKKYLIYYNIREGFWMYKITDNENTNFKKLVLSALSIEDNRNVYILEENKPKLSLVK